MKKKTLVCLLAAGSASLVLASCGPKKNTQTEPGKRAETAKRTETASAGTEESESKEWFELVEQDWEEQEVQLDTGIRMCYLTCGPEDGQPLLLIHGATDSRVSWSQAAPKLAAAGYRCYIPELRGHGKTDKPETDEKGYTVEAHCADILNLMDKLNLDQVMAAGHSLGSLITQEILITAPERIEKAVLVSSTAQIVENPTVEWILKGDGDFLGLQGYEEERELPDSFVKDWTATTNEDENFQKAIYEHAKSLPYEDWYRIFNGCNGLDNTERLSGVTTPVDIIWGTGDTLFVKEDEDLLLESLKNANPQFYEVENATHNIHWDSKKTMDAVTDELIRFLK